jgi:dephospho-CoA kinase
MVQNKIAISGKANCGKNTVAEMLVDQLKFIGSIEKIVAIADPMKSIVQQMFPEAKSEYLHGESKLRSEIIDPKYKDENGNPLTYRRALLDLGKFGRAYYKDLWLNLMVEEANRSKEINTYIVSDVRFISEYSYLKKAGFIMIRVLRDQSAKIDDVSEKEQDSIKDSDFHFVIKNNGSLKDLQEEVDFLADKIVSTNGSCCV